MNYSNRMIKLLKWAQAQVPAQATARPAGNKAPNPKKASVALATSLLPFAEYLVNPGLNLQNVVSKGVDPKWIESAKKIDQELTKWTQANTEASFSEKDREVYVSMYQLYRAMFQLKQIYKKNLKVKITNPASYKMLFEQTIPQLSNYIYQTLSKVSKLGKIDYYSKEYRKQVLEQYRKSKQPGSTPATPAASSLGGFSFISSFIVAVNKELSPPSQGQPSRDLIAASNNIKNICEQTISSLNANEQINPEDKKNIQYHIDTIWRNVSNYLTKKMDFPLEIIKKALGELGKYVSAQKSASIRLRQNLIKKAQEEGSYVTNNDPMSLKTLSELKTLGIKGLQVLEKYGQYFNVEGTPQVDVPKIISGMVTTYLDKYGAALKVASEELYNYVAEIITLCNQKNLQGTKEHLEYLASLSKESFEVTDTEVQTTREERAAIRRAEEPDYSKDLETMTGDVKASYDKTLQDVNLARSKIRETIQLLSKSPKVDNKALEMMQELKDLYNFNSPLKYDYGGGGRTNPVELQINKILSPTSPEPWNIKFNFDTAASSIPVDSPARNLFDSYQKLQAINGGWNDVIEISDSGEVGANINASYVANNKYKIIKALKDADKKLASLASIK